MLVLIVILTEVSWLVQEGAPKPGDPLSRNRGTHSLEPGGSFDRGAHSIGRLIHGGLIVAGLGDERNRRGRACSRVAAAGRVSDYAFSPQLAERFTDFLLLPFLGFLNAKHDRRQLSVEYSVPRLAPRRSEVQDGTKNAPFARREFGGLSAFDDRAGSLASQGAGVLHRLSRPDNGVDLERVRLF